MIRPCLQPPPSPPSPPVGGAVAQDLLNLTDTTNDVMSGT